MLVNNSSVLKLKRLVKKLKTSNPKEALQIEKILKQGMTSVKKTTKLEIEGYLETAFQKYFQIMMMPNSTYVNHWTSPLRSCLKNIVKTNSNQWARGYVLTLDEIKVLVEEAKEEGFEEAFKHLKDLKMNYKEARSLYFDRDISLEDLFEFGGVELPNWKKYES